MPIRLTHPFQTVALDVAKLAAMKIENNPSKGTHWLELWVILGREEEGVFVQYADPRTGDMAPFHFKLEHGCHPLTGLALGRCDTCGAWHPAAAGVCGKDACEGSIQPYDGMARMCQSVPAGALCMYEAIQKVIYGFLTTEEVPDPTTWEPIKLLDGTVE